MQFKTVPFALALTLSRSAYRVQAATHREPQQAMSGRHEAPFLDPPEDADLKLIPNTYAVAFFFGHTVAQHEAAIGVSLQPNIYHVLDLGDHTVYGARSVDDELLAAIRSDPGVAYVRVEREACLEGKIGVVTE